MYPFSAVNWILKFAAKYYTIRLGCQKNVFLVQSIMLGLLNSICCPLVFCVNITNDTVCSWVNLTKAFKNMSPNYYFDIFLVLYYMNCITALQFYFFNWIKLNNCHENTKTNNHSWTKKSIFFFLFVFWIQGEILFGHVFVKCTLQSNWSILVSFNSVRCWL